MPIQWIEIDEKRIFYIDYRGLKSQEMMLDNLEKATQELLGIEPGFLLLLDFRDVSIGYEFQKRSNKLSLTIKKLQPQKAAILGMTGLKKLIIRAFNLVNKEQVVLFDTKDEALAYLVS